MNKGRKISGGKYHANRKKKFYEQTGQERIVTLGERKTKLVRTRGGNNKLTLLNSEFVNVIVNNKSKKVEIKKVLETPQNNFLARQNRLMKGSIIETEIGKAKITNRPTREGTINAIILKE
jgi:small subunit ribosomal protein S8e|tara:strand:+ start:1900 stop:2262 length:363 start_codon:yes stop_codon:yes gene_type:complete